MGLQVCISVPNTTADIFKHSLRRTSLPKYRNKDQFFRSLPSRLKVLVSVFSTAQTVWWQKPVIPEFRICQKENPKFKLLIRYIVSLWLREARDFILKRIKKRENNSGKKEICDYVFISFNQ